MLTTGKVYFKFFTALLGRLALRGRVFGPLRYRLGAKFPTGIQSHDAGLQNNNQITRFHKSLPEAVRFERTDRGVTRSLDYKSSAFGRSATPPVKLVTVPPCLAANRVEASWLRVKDSVLRVVGRGLERIQSPARLAAFEFVDPESNETIYLYTSEVYSVLCIGDRRFYFDRITGKYDGTSAPSAHVSGRVELPD